MKTLRSTLPYLLLGGLLVPPVALAQRAPSGVGGYASSIHPATSLGAGQFIGGGAELVAGMTPRLSLIASGGMYRNAMTEAGTHKRIYDLYTPALGVRASVLGQRVDLALIGEVGADVYRLKEREDGLMPQTRVLPAISAGAALRAALVGPLHLEVSGRDRLSYARDNELVVPSGDRRVGHSPEFRLSLQLLFRPRESLEHAMSKQSPRFTEGMRPVRASEVIFEPIQTNQGRNHVHVGDGATRRVEVVDASVFNGERSPGANSTVLVESGALVPMTEQVLGAIYFVQGSHDVGTTYQNLLRDVALYLRQNPGAILEMRGYTDPVGGGTFNLSLAERRGTAVQELLVRLYGVSPEHIRVRSMGIDYRSSRENVARRVDLIAKLPVR
jgi:outer membrane protein OmpA-like peptidoglycan-associated protein